LEHIQVLREEFSAVFSAKEIKNRLMPVLTTLMTDPDGERLFCVKVDPSPQGYSLPDYSLIVKKPMDLGTIQKMMLNGAIKTPSVFVDNVELTFKNAMRYHPYREYVWNIADRLLKVFHVEMKKVGESMRKVREEKF
jgi:hypothetical protein